MKKIIIIILLLLAALLLYVLSCNCGNKFSNYLHAEVAKVINADNYAGVNFQVDGQDVLIDGQLDAANADLLTQQLESIPGVASVSMDIQPAPVSPVAAEFELHKAGDNYQLKGLVADAKERDAILQLLGDYKVDSDLQIAKLNSSWQSPLAWLEMTFAFERLDFVMRAAKVNLKGDLSAGSAQRPDLIERKLRDLLPDAQISTDIALSGLSSDARACQSELTTFLSNNLIQFEVGNAALLGDAKQVVAELIEIVKTCPEVQLSIAGHTDNTGNVANNQQLSEARAATVLQAMQAAGIAADSLHAIGYGDTRPRASNDSEAGRQLNRRIEISIR